MKVHNDLNELLEDFSWFIKLNRFYDKEHINKMIIDYTSSNSLALGKPEPLAKNKQFEKSCPRCGLEYTKEELRANEHCNNCGEEMQL